jgi:hypothetical protein
MALYDIIGAIQTKMSTISGIGTVHDYERWAISWQRFLELYAWTDPDTGERSIRGWTLSRRATTEDRETSASNLTRHQIFCRGIMGLEDSSASEKTFQNLIESVRESFRPELYLTDTAFVESPVEVRTVEVRMIGNVLCHYAELVFNVAERNLR